MTDYPQSTVTNFGSTMTDAARPGSSQQQDAWQKWNWITALGLYGLLGGATIWLMSQGWQGWTATALPIGLSLLLGALGWLLITSRQAQGGKITRNLVYLLGVYLLWILLVQLAPVYIIIVFILPGQTFTRLPLKWSLILTSVIPIVIFWHQRLLFTDGSAIPTIISNSLSFIVMALLAFWINAIIRQSLERKALIIQLEQAQTELAEASHQAGIMAERQRLAHEIHDTLAQGFISIVMHLEAAEGALKIDPLTTHSHLDQARQTARDSLVEARRLVWALRPEPLDGASLLEALQRVTASRFRTTTVNTEVRVSGTPGQLPVEYEVVLLRAAQEALANSQRHAQPGNVTVTLSYMNDEIVLDVQDDGCGFDPGLTALERPGVAEGGAGLRTMRERLAEYGGTLVIESSAGEGTTVVATLPLRQPPAAVASDLSTAVTMPPGA